MPPIFQRLTAFFCLAVVLVTGLTPSNGFVICLEPDGCVSIEVETSASECGGCEGHEATDAESTAVSGDACPCLDLPIPGSSEDRRLERKSLGFRLAAFEAPASAIAEILQSAPSLHRSPRSDAPRPPETLALIRTVVLLV
jgi:hypothetical protein